MRLCIECNEVEVIGIARFCKGCQDNRKNAQKRAVTAARSAERRCACGCGKHPGGRSKYTPECSARIRKEKKAGYSRKNVKEVTESKPRKVEKSFTPNRIVMTAAQVDAACKKAEAELRTRRETLNPQLLAARMLGRAVCNYMGGTQ